MSKFGAWFLRRPEGPVEMPEVLTGAVERVAESYEEFVREVNQRWRQKVYLLSAVVYELHQVDMIPGPGECYGLVPHPALGGPNPFLGQYVDPRFVMVLGIGAWQSLCSQALHGGE